MRKLLIVNKVVFLECEIWGRSPNRDATKILKAEGIVKDAEMILRDDSRCAYLGNTEMIAQFHNPELAAEKTILEVLMG